MKLIQKKFPHGTSEFVVEDDCIRITNRKLLTSNSFVVPLSDLKSTPSYHRSFPLPALVAALFFAGLATLSVFGMIHDSWVKDRLGMYVMFAVWCCGVAVCVIKFFQQRIDVAILHSASTALPVLVLHRAIPSETHVNEFLEIIKERIDVSRRQE